MDISHISDNAFLECIAANTTGLPLEVSLSRTTKDPGLFPGARSSRSVSLLPRSLKNHLQGII